MKKSLREALAECLDRLQAGEELQSLLRDSGRRAFQLQPLLETAGALRSLPIEPYSAQAFQAGRSRLLASLAARRAGASGAGSALGWGSFRRPLALSAVAALVAVIALLAVTTDLFRFGSSTTQAQVQGVLSSVQDRWLVVHTPDGPVSINRSDSTQVVDSQGLPSTLEQIVPGGAVRVEVKKQGKDLSAVRVEVEPAGQGQAPVAVQVEFSGIVTAVNGSNVTLSAPFGTVVVHLTAGTEVEGNIVNGAAIEVHATKSADGSFTAREVKVTGANEGRHEGPANNGGNPGPGGGDDGDGDDKDANEGDDEGGGDADQDDADEETDVPGGGGPGTDGGDNDDDSDNSGPGGAIQSSGSGLSLDDDGGSTDGNNDDDDSGDDGDPGSGDRSGSDDEEDEEAGSH